MPHYKPTLRPAGYATLPTGIKWHYTEAPDYLPKAPAPRSRHPHGIIETDRDLTAEECATFDLEPVLPPEEPTDQGIQYVVPGCERGPDPETGQGSLW